MKQLGFLTTHDFAVHGAGSSSPRWPPLFTHDIFSSLWIWVKFLHSVQNLILTITYQPSPRLQQPTTSSLNNLSQSPSSPLSPKILRIFPILFEPAQYALHQFQRKTVPQSRNRESNINYCELSTDGLCFRCGRNNHLSKDWRIGKSNLMCSGCHKMAML